MPVAKCCRMTTGTQRWILLTISTTSMVTISVGPWYQQRKKPGRTGMYHFSNYPMVPWLKSNVVGSKRLSSNSRLIQVKYSTLNTPPGKIASKSVSFTHLKLVQAKVTLSITLAKASLVGVSSRPLMPKRVNRNTSMLWKGTTVTLPTTLLHYEPTGGI